MTFKTFVAVTDILGTPENPLEGPDYTNVELPVCDKFDENFSLPSLEVLGVKCEFPDQQDFLNHWIGGETHGLKLMKDRIAIEKEVCKK